MAPRGGAAPARDNQTPTLSCASAQAPQVTRCCRQSRCARPCAGACPRSKGAVSLSVIPSWQGHVPTPGRALGRPAACALPWSRALTRAPRLSSCLRMSRCPLRQAQNTGVPSGCKTKHQSNPDLQRCQAGGLLWGWPFPGSHQVPSVHGGTRLQQLVHELAVTLRTGPVPGRAVELGCCGRELDAGSAATPGGPTRNPIPRAGALNRAAYSPVV